MTRTARSFGWLVVVAGAAVGCSGLLGYDDVDFSDADDGGVAGQAQGGAATDGGPGGNPGAGQAGTAGQGPAGQGGNAGGVGGSAGMAGTGGTAGSGGVAGTGGTAGSGGSGGTGGSGGSGGTAGTGGQGGSGGSTDPCAGVTCGAHSHCEPSNKQCVCDPGFVSQGGKCEPALPGDPTNHSEKEVCEHWKSGHVISDPRPWTAGVDTCDPGKLSRKGIDDTLKRLNMFRWLVGLGPVSDDARLNEYDQYCAVVAAWNPPGTVPNPHHPPSSAKCYTAKGAQGAGSSNIAWGSRHPANAIDQYIQDRGNYSTFGHRRWIFNAPLGPVGIGYYAGGGPYGDGQCLGVFSSSGGGPYPEWISFPPPGYSPISIVSWVWTFHHKQSVSKATMTVTRKSDSAKLDMKKMPLSGGYGRSYNAVAFQIQGWTPKVGETYLVHIEGVGSGPIDYEVKPVSCK